MNKPKITVYIISHNYGRFLTDAIESVMRQSVDNWELLLFNENSADNTQEIMEMYAGDKRVRVFKTEGIGLPKVANMATRESVGEYIIRLDGDDVFDENILLVLGNDLDKNPETALVFPDYYLVDPEGGIISEERKMQVFEKDHAMDTPANGACTLIRKDILKKVGGYREDLGAQDGFDLWTKVIKDHKCSNINLPLFYYRRHGENLTEKQQRIFSARQAIKRDASKLKLVDYQPITAVIPCRENYDIYPDLWSKTINDEGLTLLDITIQNCIASPLFSNIVVTCDNTRVKEVMDKYDDKRLSFVLRTSKSTLRSVSITTTLENVIKSLKLAEHGILLLSYIQAPFTSTASMEEAIYTMVVNDADSSFAVEEINQSLFKKSGYGLELINSKGRVNTDFDIVYRDCRTTLATRNKNILSGSLIGAKVGNYVIPDKEAFFIQNRVNFSVAQILWSNFKSDD